MNERLVVSFRWHSVETAPARYLAAAERVARRINGLGARSLSWGADTYSFACEPDEFRVVLKTSLDLLSEAPTHSVGMSARALVYDAARAWGPALVMAEALAGAAAPGEILLDPQISEVQLGLLASVGTMPTRVGEERVEALLLLPGACPIDGFKPAALNEAEPPTMRLSGGPPALDRATAAAARALSSRAPPKPDSVPPQATQTSLGVTSAALQPMSEVAVGADRPSKRSSFLTKDERPSVLEALRSGSAEVMRALASELRANGGQEQLAKRLESMAELAAGRVELGLQGLADAASASRISGGPDQCQAALAYAVGLAQAGRQEQALQETLRGLARARERADAKGERACCQLAAQLAAAAGHPAVAATWREAAAACATD